MSREQRGLQGRRLRFLSPYGAVAAVVALSGCGGGPPAPDLVDVEGTVTLDQQPLADAIVIFTPEGWADGQSARPAAARTDEDGHYRLEFSNNHRGAQPGKYRVGISTYQEFVEDEEGNDLPGTEERVPAVYNSESTLMAEVTAGSEPIDFELSSRAGPVLQPVAYSDDMEVYDDSSDDQ